MDETINDRLLAPDRFLELRPFEAYLRRLNRANGAVTKYVQALPHFLL
jgi:hypothetical protein